jgi:hypothetical protein
MYNSWYNSPKAKFARLGASMARWTRSFREKRVLRGGVPRIARRKTLGFHGGAGAGVQVVAFLIHLNAKFPYFSGNDRGAYRINLLKFSCGVCDSYYELWKLSATLTARVRTRVKGAAFSPEVR